MLIHSFIGLGDEYKTEKKPLTQHGYARRQDEMMPMLYPVESERIDSTAAKDDTSRRRLHHPGRHQMAARYAHATGIASPQGGNSGPAVRSGTTGGSEPRGMETAQAADGVRRLPPWLLARGRAENTWPPATKLLDPRHRGPYLRRQ